MQLFQAPEDDWSGVAAREERKKRQNRINQRARRQRKADELGALDQRPFKIQRWRVIPSSTAESTISGEQQGYQSKIKPHGSTKWKKNAKPLIVPESSLEEKRLLHPHFELPSWWDDGELFSPLAFPLSSDHVLLHLVHFNVFRALTSNKSLLSSLTYLTKPMDQGPIPLLPGFKDFCEGITLLHPKKDVALPEALRPTYLQGIKPHSSWLNMFPWPRFRDNLIEREGYFDTLEFCADLWGEIYTNVPEKMIPRQLAVSARDVAHEDVGKRAREILWDDAGEDFAARRRGMIVWSEPWDENGWEVTPDFVRKWAWTLQGCEGLIKASNRWRAIRDENPLDWESLP